MAYPVDLHPSEQGFLLDPKSFMFLLTHINKTTEDVKWLRKYVYLITLWFASTSPLTAAEREYTVAKLSTVNTKFLFFKNFERTKSAYRAMDEFEREEWAASKLHGNRRVYWITEAGSRRAGEVLDQFALNRLQRQEVSKMRETMKASQKEAVLLNRLPGAPQRSVPTVTLETLEKQPAALYDFITTVDVTPQQATEDEADEILNALENPEVAEAARRYDFTPADLAVLQSYKRLAELLHVTPAEAHAAK